MVGTCLKWMNIVQNVRLCAVAVLNTRMRCTATHSTLFHVRTNTHAHTQTIYQRMFTWTSCGTMCSHSVYTRFFFFVFYWCIKWHGKDFGCVRGGTRTTIKFDANVSNCCFAFNIIKQFEKCALLMKSAVTHRLLLWLHTTRYTHFCLYYVVQSPACYCLLPVS